LDRRFGPGFGPQLVVGTKGVTARAWLGTLKETIQRKKHGSCETAPILGFFDVASPGFFAEFMQIMSLQFERFGNQFKKFSERVHPMPRKGVPNTPSRLIVTKE
jgi:hypothetical protein